MVDSAIRALLIGGGKLGELGELGELGGSNPPNQFGTAFRNQYFLMLMCHSLDWRRMQQLDLDAGGNVNLQTPFSMFGRVEDVGENETFPLLTAEC